MKLYPFNGLSGVKFHFAVLAVVLMGAAGPESSGPALARRAAKMASGARGVRLDPALSKVAAKHASDVLEDFGSAQRERVKRALRKEGLADAQVWPFAAVGTDLPTTVARAERFARDQARPRGPTHVGAAVSTDADGRHAVVVLFSRRTVALAPLPARLPRDRRLEVRGRVTGRAPLTALWLGPCGADCPGAPVALSVERAGDTLTVPLPAPAGPGRYVFQLVTDGPRGPEVAAHWVFRHRVAAAAWPPSSHRAARDDVAEAQARVDRLRSRLDLAPLAPHPALATAAAAYAQALCAGKITAHRLPGRAGVGERLKATGYPGRVAENVARAAHLAQAQDNLRFSPSHRRNLTDPFVAHLGVGVARAPAADGVAPSVCLVQLFGTPQR